MRVLAFCLLLLLVGCGTRPPEMTGGDERGNGGDPLRSWFEDARLTAANKILRLRPSHLDAMKEKGVGEWLSRNQLALAQDILASPLDWVESARPTCARTDLKGRATVTLSIPTCRQGVFSVRDAARQLWHEGVHHFGIGDEAFADALAKALDGVADDALNGTWKPLTTNWTAPPSFVSDITGAAYQDETIYLWEDGVLVSYDLRASRWEGTRLSDRSVGPKGRTRVSLLALPGKILVYGGLWAEPPAHRQGIGFVTDRASGTSRAMSPTGDPACENFSSLFWTGKEALVWCTNGKGALYDPALDRWRPLAPGPDCAGPPRGNSCEALAYSDRLLVLAYDVDGEVSFHRYDPATDHWETKQSETKQPFISGGLPPQMAWTGESVIFYASDNPLGPGALWNPEQDTWSLINPEGAPSPRYGSAVTWTGRYLLVQGGRSEFEHADVSDGAMYDPATGKWWELALDRAPSPRSHALSLWTGKQWFVFGGFRGEKGYDGEALQTGAIFTP